MIYAVLLIQLHVVEYYDYTTSFDNATQMLILFELGSKHIPKCIKGTEKQNMISSEELRFAKVT